MRYYLQKIKLNHKGFSLLELLIALVIIGILSVIAVNRYTERSEEARINAAKSELKAIADAERQCEIDTGWYVTLRALDDIKGGNSQFIIDNGLIQYRIEDEPIPYAIDTDGAFYLQRIDIANWNGPYINYQSVDTTGDPTFPSNYGSPMDPWGRPYRLFTEIELTNPVLNETGYAVYLPSDRMKVITYGKNGLPGDGDDIVFRF